MCRRVNKCLFGIIVLVSTISLVFEVQANELDCEVISNVTVNGTVTN